MPSNFVISGRDLHTPGVADTLQALQELVSIPNWL
jgi:hypothetical protein